MSTTSLKTPATPPLPKGNARTRIADLATYAQREQLHNEVHARPYNRLFPPSRISYIVMFSTPAEGDDERAALSELARTFGADLPSERSNHYTGNLGALQVKWERHAEFARYTFIKEEATDEPFATRALDHLPEGWLAKLPGKLLLATEVALLRGPVPDDMSALTRDYFEGNSLIASKISGGAGCAITDFRLREDGASRLLIYDLGMRPRQAGRAVQRLLEIDTYRMMALLALPGAQALRPFLATKERELAALTASMIDPNPAHDQDLLNRLTSLEGETQSRYTENHYRLSAAAAYYEIVERRIAELREERLGGLQTFREFMERRLVPAMSTCRSVTRNAEELSERLSRCTALLSTRVSVSQEAQNRQLLQSMARRAKMQLQLQRTVEGLSIAAISYYIIGLVGYAAKSVAAAGVNVNPDIVVGISVPVVVGLVFLGLQRARRHLIGEEDEA